MTAASVVREFIAARYAHKLQIRMLRSGVATVPLERHWCGSRESPVRNNTEIIHMLSRLRVNCILKDFLKKGDS